MLSPFLHGDLQITFYEASGGFKAVFLFFALGFEDLRNDCFRVSFVLLACVGVRVCL